jgi:hypothetical protein
MYAQNLQIWVSINSCSGLSLQLQVQWRKSKENLSCSCWNCHDCSRNTQACQPLQFAKFSSACFEFDPMPPHSGSIGNYESYNHGCISSIPSLVSVPKLSQTCLCMYKMPCRLCWLLYPVPSSMSKVDLIILIILFSKYN